MNNFLLKEVLNRKPANTSVSEMFQGKYINSESGSLYIWSPTFYVEKRRAMTNIQEIMSFDTVLH